MSIHAKVTPVVASVSDPGLKQALMSSFEKGAQALARVESAFDRFTVEPPKGDAARTFMKSWHSTHLKMLPIYGLSCRLQTLGKQSEGARRDDYFMAATRNAETSHEDLAVGTPHLRPHAVLYDNLAGAVCGDDGWRLDGYCIPEAAEFKNWIYDRMVYAPIETGLLTNMFSEIYNHGEYSRAMDPFEGLLGRMGYDENSARRLGVYIRCHVDSDVEEAHFNCVFDALEHYNRAEGRVTDAAAAEALFDEYLTRSGAVMEALERRIDAMQ